MQCAAGVMVTGGSQVGWEGGLYGSAEQLKESGYVCVQQVEDLIEMVGMKSDDDASVSSGRQRGCVLTAPCTHMVLCRRCSASGEDLNGIGGR